LENNEKPPLPISIENSQPIQIESQDSKSIIRSTRATIGMLIVAIIAVAISFVSSYFSYRNTKELLADTRFYNESNLRLLYNQYNETLEFNKNAVKPHLEFNYNFDTTKESASISLSNNGIGPAYINSFEVYIDSVEVKDKYYWSAIFESLDFISLLNQYAVTGRTFSDNSVIPIGEKQVIFEIRKIPNVKVGQNIASIINNRLVRLKFKITYSSLFYGENYQAVFDLER